MSAEWRDELAGPESAAEHVRNAVMILNSDWLLPPTWAPGDPVPELSELPEEVQVSYAVFTLNVIRARLMKAIEMLEQPRAAGGAVDGLTPGPWCSDGEVVGWWSGEQPAVRVAYEKEPGLWHPVAMCPADNPSAIADAAFIAEARNAKLQPAGGAADATGTP